MPWTCYSYPPDLPPGNEDRGAARSGLRGMPYKVCFRYQPEVPRSMPLMCFSYPVEAPPGSGNRNATPQVLDGLRRMPYSSCFRY
jgi:hypothetical protein